MPQIAPSHVDQKITVSFYPAELQAIFFALKQAYQSQESKLMIFADSLSALQALETLKADHLLLIQIQDMLQKNDVDQTEIVFYVDS